MVSSTVKLVRILTVQNQNLRIKSQIFTRRVLDISNKLPFIAASDLHTNKLPALDSLRPLCFGKTITC